MRRAVRAVQAGALLAVLALLTVPFAINAAPALIVPAEAAQGRSAAQSPPQSLSQVSIATEPRSEARKPDQQKLSQLLDAALTSVPGTFTGQVIDAASGTQLYGRDPQAPMLPASNLKLLTAITTLKNLGPTTTFSTTVRLLSGGASGPAALVLRAGGDALLASGASDPQAVAGHAGLATLAKQTAEALGSRSGENYRLFLDDSIFTGPALNPRWERDDVQAGEIAPIYPIAITSASPALGSSGPRPDDAAMQAAQSFASALAANGVQVQGQPVRLTSQSTQLQDLTSVQSANVAAQVAYMLRTSDNYLSEVLARMSATAVGREGSSDEAIAVVKETITGLGLNLDRAVLADNAGLSPHNRLSAAQMTAAVRLIARSEDPALRHALEGLPVAGLTGTLKNRYATALTQPGAGLVRAKTGTLNTVMTLSGTVVDAHGRLLLFSFMANDLPGRASSAPPALDRAAAVLANCGC